MYETVAEDVMYGAAIMMEQQHSNTHPNKILRRLLSGSVHTQTTTTQQQYEYTPHVTKKGMLNRKDPELHNTAAYYIYNTYIIYILVDGSPSSARYTRCRMYYVR